MQHQNTLAYAQQLDEQDKLKQFRQQFYIPQHNGKDCVYFTGNSLGLQPKSTASYIQQELNDWAQHGVEGHFNAKNPWLSYHEMFAKPLSVLVGAKEHEVVAMNQLTVNLHLLMVSFYKPTKQKFKIICEAKAFPSDQYALESQVKFHGYSYEEAVIEIAPRIGEYCIRVEDILEAIEKNKHELALVVLGGVNYYTGQLFNMQAITTAAHAVGAYCGFDLAHAAGNVPIALHDWEVDFACWCSYKYLNSGPGGVAGVFIHEKHVGNPTIPRFAGWWGYTKATRFKMDKGFEAIPTAEGWQLSNAPVLSMAAHKASLDVFMDAGWQNIQAKAKLLNNYLWFVLQDINEQCSNTPMEIITPNKEEERGCQVSLLMHQKGKEVFNALTQHGVIADWREPNVIRIAPVALYNSFKDVYRFGEIVKTILG